jgi:polar amino acid transport system substrate-binding protein
MFRSRFLVALFLSLLLTHVTQAFASGRLDTIMKRGEINVGVKVDYPPFGMLDSDGNPIGLEHDLAVDLARRLGVKLHVVAVTGANRLQALDDGRVDAVIATTADTEERRKIATMVEPSYYSSGVTLMTRPDVTLTQWADLRGQQVCATQGSYFNRIMATRDLLSLQVYGSGRDAKLAVRDKRCVGWLFDNTAIAGDLRATEWHDYHATLPLQLITPWSIAIAQSESGGDLNRAIGNTVADWHRSGFLIQLEKQWGLPPSRFLANEFRRWNAKDANGQFICRRDANGQWPVQCRNQIFVVSSEVTGLRKLGLYVKEKTGINLTFIYDDYERAQFIHGVLTTLALTVSCVIGSLLVGIAFATIVDANIAIAGRAIQFSALVGRMTPPLVQIYVLFFGIGSIVSRVWNIRLSPFMVVVVCLSFTTGSSVMNAMLNAAEARRKVVNGFRLTFAAVPEVIIQSSAPVTAALVNVTKATMMASAISVPDLLSVSTSIIAEHGDVGVVMNTLMLFYLTLSFTVIRVFRLLERKGAKWVSAKH